MTPWKEWRSGQYILAVQEGISRHEAGAGEARRHTALKPARWKWCGVLAHARRSSVQPTSLLRTPRGVRSCKSEKSIMLGRIASIQFFARTIRSPFARSCFRTKNPIERLRHAQRPPCRMRSFVRLGRGLHDCSMRRRGGINSILRKIDLYRVGFFEPSFVCLQHFDLGKGRPQLSEQGGGHIADVGIKECK